MSDVCITDIAQRLEVDIPQGLDASVHYSRLSNPHNADRNSVSFVATSKYRDCLSGTQAGLLITKQEWASSVTKNTSVICLDDPYLAYAKISSLFSYYSNSNIQTSIAKCAKIDASVVLGEGVVIGRGVVIHAGVVIGSGVIIGDNSIIYPNVVLYKGIKIGAKCIIHAGSIIGADGFGFVLDGQNWVKIEHLGGVVIADDVEIGANCTIDRGSIDDTIVSKGVKIDNLVHIAHNCFIGENTAIAAQSGIAGSSKIGKRCLFGGQTGVGGNHIELCDDSVLVAGSIAYQDIDKPGIYASPAPLQTKAQWIRRNIELKRITDG